MYKGSLVRIDQVVLDLLIDDTVIHYRSTMYKDSLVRIDQVVQQRFESCNKDFGDNLVCDIA